jgi:hypothetical protein
MALPTFLNSVEVERTGTTNPQTWTHVPNGTAKAIVVAIVHGTSSTDHVSAVTYGGVAMTRKIRATDTVTEPGAAELWFLGTGIPTGNQTVSASLNTNTTDDMHFVSMSFSAPGDTTAFVSGSVSENQADPSVTLAYGGRTAVAVAALYGGGATSAAFTPNGNCTTVQTFNIGASAFYSSVIRQTTAGTADFAIGGTAVSDDVAFVAMALSEIASIGVVAGAATVTGVASFSSFRRTILNGLDSAQAEGTGWDAKKTLIAESAVVRTSATVVTITLPAIASYDITASEVITDTVPAITLVGGLDLVASPTLGITALNVGAVTGNATVTAVGSSTAVSSGASSGTATATGVGRATAVSAGTIAGLATAAMIGLSTVVSVGAATGGATVLGVKTGASNAVSVGAATVSGVGAASSLGIGAVPFTDDFNHFSIGFTWETVLGTPWDIVSSLYLKPFTANASTAVRVRGTFVDDQFAEVFTEVPTPGGLVASQAGPAVRMDGVGSCYYLRILSSSVSLYKRVLGVETLLNSAAVTTPLDTLTKFRITVAGSLITVMANGAQIFTQSDTALISGKPGCAGLMGDAAILPRFDNFSSTLPGALAQGAGAFTSAQPGASTGLATVLGVGQPLSQAIGASLGTASVVGRYGAFVDARRPILNGLVSAQSETHGWNAIRALIPDAAVVRTSNTVVTITLPGLPSYAISALETITDTVPGIALNSGLPLVATPTFGVIPNSEADGAVDGVADVQGISQSTYRSLAAAAGSATVTGVGASLSGTGAGIGAAVGAAVPLAASTVSAAGVGIAVGAAGADGQKQVGNQGISFCTSTVTAVGTGTVVRGATAQGSASVIGVGSASSVAIGAATGAATVLGSQALGSLGLVTGAAAVSGVGQSVAIGVGNASGGSSVVGSGAGLGASVGLVFGTSTATAVSSGSGTGVAQGDALVQGVGIAFRIGVGVVTGTAIVLGGGGNAISVGLAAGDSTVTAVGGVVVPSSFKPAWASNSNQRVA